jgi:predicted AAA+ superfamily ATPase
MRSVMSLVPRFFKPPKQSFFLFGPRGTGKSTWLKSHYADALWIDLREPDLLQFYSASPHRLRDLVDAHPEKKCVVIDEIQYVPELLTLVHALIEEKRGLQFILTGSSARKLKRVGTDLLAGRAILKKMSPFFAAELKDEFDLERALVDGLLPLVWSSPIPEEVLKTYAALYLKEEVQAEGLVRQVGDFARFMEVISFSHGSVLNTTNIARDCGVSRKTVDTYLQILEDLLLSFTLPVFTRRAQKALTTHPKFYLFDAGVFRSLRPKGPLDRSEEITGAALEGLVAQHLRAWIESQVEHYEFAFWRTRSGTEVDFIVYGAKGFWAIEVKNSDRLSPADTRGLESFKEDYPEVTPILVYRGKQRLMQKGVLCIPCAEFLLNINPGDPLPS